MIRALCLGGAACLFEDQEKALALFRPDFIVATNHAGRDYPGAFAHWASYHVELFPKWLSERRAAGQPDPDTLWTATRRPPPPGLEARKVPNWGGSSGLLAVTVALELGADKIVLAGIPLDRDQAHYDNSAPWCDAGNYRRAWLSHTEEMRGRVRSMSGWTRELLGEPDEGWINAEG